MTNFNNMLCIIGMGQYMNKKLITVIIIFILAATIIPVHGLYNISENGTSQTNYIGNGWLEERNGIKILHISGSNYEMGFQHGFLLKQEVKQNLRAFLNYSPVSYEYLLEIWDTMKDYVPQDYIDEMQGLADGAEVTFDEVAAAYMVIVVGDLAGCFGISAWGTATKDGKLYHTRSFDQPMDIKDPETGIFAHENYVLIIRNPNNGYASMIPSVAGAMHGGGGINEQGIAIGQQVCWSRDYIFEGTPAVIKVQMVLDHATNIDEVCDILITNKTLGWNFIVSDAKVPVGYAVEITGNYSYAGTYDDPTEGKYPFWNIEDVVRRTNFFIDPCTAKTQRDRYNPGGLINFIKLVLRTDVFYAVWRSYKVNSEGIENNLGSMDLNSTMSMIRNCYSGKTDFLLRLIVTLAEGTSFNRAWNMWVAEPISGDMVVCFAEKDSIAFDNPVHHFNFYDLLNTVPP